MTKASELPSTDEAELGAAAAAALEEATTIASDDDIWETIAEPDGSPGMMLTIGGLTGGT